MSLGMTYSPKVPGGGAATYKLDQCLHIIMVIGKCTVGFRGFFFGFGGGVEGRGLCGSIFISLF